MKITGRIRDVRMYDPQGEYMASMTVNPNDVIRIKTTFINTSEVREEFLVGVSIGSPKKWYDVGYFFDEFGDYAEVTVNPGDGEVVSRMISIPDDVDVTDVWVTLKDRNLGLLDEFKLPGVLSVVPAVILPPVVPEPEIPTDITDKLIGLLKDILFEGVYVQDALVKWDILPAWVGTIFNKVIDFLSVNVAPEGERPLRIMFPGGSFITKRLPKISAGVADDVVKLMIREGAEKLTAKIAKSPAKMAVSLKRLPESALIKLFQGLSASPVGRIAIFNIVKILDVGGAEKAAQALAKSELTETAAKSIYQKIGPAIGKKFYNQAGRPKRWETYPKAWKWWLGLGGAIMGYATMNMWLAKEAVWEAPLYPISDLIRDEKWEIADEEIGRLVAAADFYEKTVKILGWLSPVAMIIYKRGIEEIRTNITLWRSQIDSGLAKAPPPIPPAPIPPVAPPEEPPEIPPEEVPPTEPPEEKEPPTADKAYVTITSNPAGASIWIDGKNTWTVTPFAHLLDQGSHNLQLQLFRHHSIFQNITVIGGKNMVKSYEMKPLAIEEEEKPFIPLPIEVPLVPVTRPVTKPTAWEYTITAKDAATGEIVSAKIIVNGIYTGKYTTNNIILEPEAEYTLRLEAFGYEPGEFTLTTEPLPE